MADSDSKESTPAAAAVASTAAPLTPMTGTGTAASVSSAVPLNVLFPATPASSILGKHTKLSVLDTFNGKNVLITGATGFVGKVIVEKILRSIPNVGALYLLVRPRKGQTAEERMFKEVVSSEIFTRLRKERKDFEEFIAKKLVAVPGELTNQNIGLSPKSIDFLENNCHIILHCAAVVDFNERLDRAVELNVLGSLRLLELAQRCRQLMAFVHTSTAYVNSNRRGHIDEKLYPLGFEPEAMLEKVKTMGAPELEKVSVSGLLGEWPNTYTFTKAIAECMMVKRRGTTPLVILRPSIVGCSWKEPVPGWTDVATAAGAVYLTIGMGVLKFLPGDPNTPADVTPVDYVVNAMLGAVPAIANQNRFFVCQSTTTVENPMYWGHSKQTMQRFWPAHVPTRAVAPPQFDMIGTPQAYQIKFFLAYSVPSALFNSLASVGLGGAKTKQLAQQFNKLVWRARVVSESFRHFVENTWNFDNKNVRAIGEAIVESERDEFWLSIRDLNWFSYNNTFGFGLMRYVLKEDMIEMDKHDVDNSLSLSETDWTRGEGAVDSFVKNHMSDLHFVWTQMSERPDYPVARPVSEMRSVIFSHPKVQAAMKAESGTSKLTPQQIESRARGIIDKMFGDSSLQVMGGLAWFFRKVWRRIYENISVDKSGVEQIRALAAKGPLIFMPSHRSYIDFLVVSYLCFCCHLPLPYIAAGEDFLGILLVRWLFRKSGAFFIKRSFLGTDPLYTAIFSSYIEALLLDGQSLEFFVEGTRSRSGKMLHPKMGLLSVITNVFLDRKVPDVTIVPVNINYEKTMEGDLYSNELLGDNKIKESLRSLLRSSSVLNVNFGQIVLAFGTPFSLKDYTDKHVQEVRANGVHPSRPVIPNIYTPPTPGTVAPAAASATASAGGFSAASFTSPFSDAKDTKSASSKPQQKSSSRTGEADNSTAVASAGDFKSYDPFSASERDRRVFNRTLAYRVVYSLAQAGEVMPTHMLATLLLMYRQGITRAQLTSKIEWLRHEITDRGGSVSGMQGEFRTAVVDKATKHLSHLIVQRRQNVLEPAITARKDYKNMLVLGHYRNKLVHLFFREGLWAVALYSFGEQMVESGVDKSKLLHEVQFLHSLLSQEFIYKSDPDEPEDFEATLGVMIKRGILKSTGGGSDGIERIEVASTGEAHFSFLCALFWPFIDSYFTASLILFSLQPNRAMEENLLLQRTQWLATTLYHESMLCFYESCSMETLRNAFVVLQSWRVIKIEKGGKVSPGGAAPVSAGGNPNSKPNVVSLLAPFTEENALQQLTQRISRLRKQPPVRHGGVRRNLIADIPILAKL